MKNLMLFFLLFISTAILSQTVPVITLQPTDQQVDFGTTATFSVSATCPDSIGYQWWKSPYTENDFVVNEPGKIEGATSNQLKILNTTFNEGNTQYVCEVYNTKTRSEGIDDNWVNSSAANLFVKVSTSKSIKITNPSNSIGNEFEVGTTIKIEWVSNNIDKVNLEYTTDDGKSWINIFKNYPASNNQYDWSVPNTPSIFCILKITDSNDEEISYMIPGGYGRNSGQWFTIYGKNKWFEVSSNTDKGLTAIKFIDKNNGFAYGNSVIVTTKDAGKNWEEQNSFVSSELSQVIFIDEKIGWGIRSNSQLYKTVNGGKTWQYTFQKSNGEIKNLVFIDDEYGWFSIDESIYKTENGGATWEFLTVPPFGELGELNILDRNFGWYTIRYRIGMVSTRLTYNGGKDWQGTGPGGYGLKFTYADERNIWKAAFTSESSLQFYKISTLSHSSNLNNYKTDFTGKFIVNSIYFFNNHIGWLSGSTVKPSWNGSTTYPSRKSSYIAMSLDSGNTWQLQSLNRSPSAIYSYDGETAWGVSGNKIMRYGEFDTSPEFWNKKIQIVDATDNLANLSYGQMNNATNEIDEALGEAELPPLPIAGTFDARFVFENNSSSLKDLRNSKEEEIIWIIQFQPGKDGYPIELSWDKDKLPFGSFFLRDAINGSIVNVDMKLEDSFTLFNDALNKLQIVFKEQFTASVENNSGWNLSSVPLTADDMEVTSVFPNATSSAFKFDKSYKSTTTLNNGLGYWIKYSAEKLSNVYGQEPTTPITLSKGWNLIGPHNKTTSIDKISTSPSGIITSDIYGFDNAYYVADKLTVGKGYWVKASQNGILNFTNTHSLSKETNKSIKNEEPNFSFNISASDGVSDSSFLTFGLDSLATDGYDPLLGEEELPPLPPLGIFDLRIKLPDTSLSSYADIRTLARNCYEHIINYQLGDSSDGLTLNWNLPVGVTLNIVDLFGGTIFNESFTTGVGSLKIANTSINRAKLTFCYSDIILSQNNNELLPNEFSLSQNYPNPFNPSTKIKFSLPKESMLTLIVYDILGREVVKLVNQNLKADFHEVEFSNSNYPSGIYFYRLQAGEFVETKKMILLK